MISKVLKMSFSELSPFIQTYKRARASNSTTLVLLKGKVFPRLASRYNLSCTVCGNEFKEGDYVISKPYIIFISKSKLESNKKTRIFYCPGCWEGIFI